MQVLIRSFLFIFLVALNWNCNAYAVNFNFFSLTLIKSACVAIVKSPVTFFSFLFREYGIALQGDAQEIKNNGEKRAKDVETDLKKVSDESKKKVLDEVTKLDRSIKKADERQQEFSTEITRNYDALCKEARELEDFGNKFKQALEKELEVSHEKVGKKNNVMFDLVNQQLDEYNEALEIFNTKMDAIKQEMESKLKSNSNGMLKKLDLLKVSVENSLQTTSGNIGSIKSMLDGFKLGLIEANCKVDGFGEKIDTLVGNQKKIDEKVGRLVEYNTNLMEENKRLHEQIEEMRTVLHSHCFENVSDDQKPLLQRGNSAYRTTLGALQLKKSSAQLLIKN